MLRKIPLVLAWASALLIVFVTLSPIGLRPHVAGVGVERFGAFAVVGLLFGLAYPTRLGTVIIGVSAAAIALEIMQHLTPDRHGHIPDALVKLAGGITGAGFAFVLNRIRDKWIGVR